MKPLNQRRFFSPPVMAGLDPRLSGLINEQYQGVIPERRASRVLSGIHVSACASFDMDSRQSLCDFGNDVEDNRKQNEPDSRRLDPAIQQGNRNTRVFLDGRL
jgi:hypothetical protein